MLLAAEDHWLGCGFLGGKEKSKRECHSRFIFPHHFRNRSGGFFFFVFFSCKLWDGEESHVDLMCEMWSVFK